MIIAIIITIIWGSVEVASNCNYTHSQDAALILGCGGGVLARIWSRRRSPIDRELEPLFALMLAYNGRKVG